MLHYHQLQQQYNLLQLQLELQLTPQRSPPVPFQALQRKLYEQRLQNLDLEQNLLKKWDPRAGTGSTATAKPVTSITTATGVAAGTGSESTPEEAKGTGSATATDHEEATGTGSTATAKPVTPMTTATEGATGTDYELTPITTVTEEAKGTGSATATEEATGTGSTDLEQQKQPQDSQVDDAQEILHDLQQPLHGIQKKFYQILLSPPPTALSSKQTTQPPPVHGQPQPASAADYSVVEPQPPSLHSSNGKEPANTGSDETKL